MRMLLVAECRICVRARYKSRLWGAQGSACYDAPGCRDAQSAANPAMLPLSRAWSLVSLWFVFAQRLFGAINGLVRQQRYMIDS